jgi:CubicO group peptidase (beta-lactamase class C family)
MIDRLEIQKKIDEITLAQRVPCIALGFLTSSFTETWISGNRALVPQVEKLTEDTLFDMASLTKVIVTTTLILKLIEDKRLNLETKASSILPDFKHSEITVLHLLAHTSGLPADHKGYRDHCGKAALRSFIMDLPLSEVPETKVIYTDFGFILLGFIIDSLMGPLNESAKKFIFDPLGMKDTGYCPVDKNRCAPTENSAQRGLIRGVVHDGKAFCLDQVSGNAGIFSSLKDTLIFAKMILSDDQRVLKNSTKALLHTTYTASLDHQRTLGWYRHDDSCNFGSLASQDVLYHTGFSGTSIYIDFERQLAIVLLTNRVHPQRDNDQIQSIRSMIHDLLIMTQ